MFTLSDFDFDLPPELIAQTALAERSASRLLEVDTPHDARHAHRSPVRRIAGPASTPGDLLVFNDTKVLKARFLGQKASGGKIEVLVERLTGETHRARADPREQEPGSRAPRSVSPMRST